MPVIGILQAIQTPAAYVDAFRQGLSEVGFVDGRNVTIDRRTAGTGTYDRLSALATDLVSRGVSVIGAITPVAALAAKAATDRIPIVFELGSDPIKDGLVSSLAKPGGNITGVTFFANLLTAKRLELIHSIVPDAKTVGFLLNPKNANAEFELNEAQTAAQTLAVQLVIAKAATEQDVDDAFKKFVQESAKAVVTAGDAYLNNSRDHQIAALALRHAIATCVSGRVPVTSGCLISYGAQRQESSRQFGVYVGRILKGEKPDELPVVQSTKFELVINLTTAKALGLTVPPTLLARADEVIE